MRILAVAGPKGDDDLFAFAPQYIFLVLVMLGIVTSRVNFLRLSTPFS
jgi:hypothetical protein